MQQNPEDSGALTHAMSIAEQIRAHDLLRQNFRNAIETLDPEYHGQWAGMGPEQVLVFGASFTDVVDQLKPNGKDHRPIVVKHLTPATSMLIL